MEDVRSPVRGAERQTGRDNQMNKLSAGKIYRRVTAVFAAALLGLTLPVASFAAALSSSQQALLQQSAAKVQAARPAMAQAPAANKKAAPAKWTVMVYMNGNSNLAPDILRIVNEMEAAGGSSSDVQMVVHLSRDAKQLTDKNPMFQTQSPAGIWTPDDSRGGSVRYHVTGDKNSQVTSIPLSASGDPGNAGTLQKFVVWAKQAYPAQRYMLMIYGHGAGMFGTSASDAAGGGSKMSIPDLSDSLRMAGGVDVLFFYSCLMQMAEVSARLDGVAKVVIGSETSMLTGLPFEPMFRTVKASASAGPDQFSKAIFKAIAENDSRLGYQDAGAQFALSAIKPSGSKKFVQALSAYVDAVMSEQDLESARLARDNAVRVFPAGEEGGSVYEDYCDLGTFVQLQASLSKSPKVQAAANALMEVMYKDYLLTVGQTGAGAEPTGVSIYLPGKGQTILPKESYEGNPIGASKWGAFIRWLNMYRGEK